MKELSRILSAISFLTGLLALVGVGVMGDFYYFMLDYYNAFGRLMLPIGFGGAIAGIVLLLIISWIFSTCEISIKQDSDEDISPGMQNFIKISALGSIIIGMFCIIAAGVLGNFYNHILQTYNSFGRVMLHMGFSGIIAAAVISIIFFAVLLCCNIRRR